ncbi:MAG TPA: hypothetical protein PLI39_09280 [Petrotogaceae bacterium]|nr:hypothetical protein [Petrotogaceae bacterium]
MPYIYISNTPKKAKRKSTRKLRRIIVLFFFIGLTVFFVYEISRQFSLYNDLKEKYDNLSQKYESLMNIYNEKQKILQDLEDKLKGKGVHFDGRSIKEFDIYNIEQTEQSTDTTGTQLR